MAQADGTVVIDTLMDTDGISDGSKRIGKSLDDVGKKSTSFGTKLKNAFSTGLKTAAKIGVAAIGTVSTAIVGLGKIGLDYNSQIEDYTVNFSTMLGSAEKGVAKVEELKKMAASTPFGLADLAESTQTLLAFNVASEESTEIMSMLGDISLGNADKLSRLSMAYGKTNSMGKLTGETLQQMIEAGFNPALIITQETGETMEEFNKRVSDGGVSVDELRKAMVKATSKGGQFNDGMKNASKTMSGLISTLTDNARALVGDVFQPISDAVANDLLPRLIDSVDQLQSAFDTGGLNGLVEAAGSMMGDYIAELTSWLPRVGNVASGLLSSLIDGLKGNADQIAGGAVELVDTFVSFIVDAAPELINAGFSLAVNLINGIAVKAPELIPDVLIGIGDLIATTFSNLPALMRAGINLVKGLIEGVIKGTPDFLEAIFGLHEETEKVANQLAEDIKTSFASFESFGERLAAVKPQIVDYAQVVSSSGQTLSDVSSLISQKENEIVNYIRDAVSNKGTLYQQDLDNLRVYIEELRALYEDELAIYRELAASEITKMSQDLKAADTELLLQRLSNVNQYVEDANATVEGWYSGEIARIESLTGIDAVEKQKMLDNATQTYNAMRGKNEAYYAEALSYAAEYYQKDIDAQQKTLDILARNKENDREIELGAYKLHLDKLNTETNNGYLTMLATLAKSGIELSDQQKENARMLLEPFVGLDEDTEKLATEYMRGLLTGMESQMPALENASELTAADMVRIVKSYLGIASPSRVMKSVGQDTIQGLIEGVKSKNSGIVSEMKSTAKNMADGLKNGLNNQLPSLLAVARNIAGKVTAAFKAKLEIHSPSRVFRDEIGAMMAKGLGEGFEMQMPKELQAMNAAINLGAIAPPVMATGTIVPPQSGYSAESRSATAGTLDALSRQIGSLLGSGDKTYQFVAQIDGRTVFNQIISEAQLRRASSGNNPFEL